ncbi:MAG: copper chaperone PCu(A)C [Gammaproteobacteria bacterium]
MFQLLNRKSRAGLLLLLAATLELSACTAPEKPAQPLSVSGAWVRLNPPGSMMTAGYGQFENTGNETIVLTGFSSPQFGDVSLHYTEDVDGTSTMREAGPKTLAPGESLTLQPGGFHLMLMQRKVPTPEGFNVDILVDLDTGEARASESSTHKFTVSRR